MQTKEPRGFALIENNIKLSDLLAIALMSGPKYVSQLIAEVSKKVDRVPKKSLVVQTLSRDGRFKRLSRGLYELALPKDQD